MHSRINMVRINPSVLLSQASVSRDLRTLPRSVTVCTLHYVLAHLATARKVDIHLAMKCLARP